MRTQVINRTPFYYALYEGKTAEIDEDGFYTGEDAPSYEEPVLYTKANISAARGTSETEQFGNLDNYDRVIVTSDMSCPINEDSILWIDEADTSKPHDYIVKRVAKSKNGISLAVAKVKVSESDNG